ncbi:hypothetical protein [Algoriphagus taiwanensis]|uniref:Uncharacterized protein n=1 Tax=Algoriphagus taiwanensis TaxID=1445656 RepID=A0ABQ6Q0Q3_9BACT|nr:hypothetical protein Ataiwa_17190 [Algoriphagus taiwanensis]
MKDNVTLLIVVGILALYFLIGIGWLLYKMTGSKPEDKEPKSPR